MTSEGPDADEAGAPPVLPGRDRELAFLLERLAQAQAGRGCIVTVAGDAGIGKSRLLDAVAGHATTAAITTWWGRCYETPGAPAFWPWTRVLRPVWRRFDEATLRALLGSGYADLETLARDETLTDSGAAGTVSGGSGDAIESRFRLFDSFSRLLHAVAGRTLPLLEHAPTGTAVAGPRGLLLLFDDLHYADASSLLLLEFVAEELATTPLLVLATYRDADLDSGHPLTRTLSRLARLPWRHHLDLGGLDTPAIKELAREAGVAILSDDQADQLRRESEGNPFFAGELLRYRRDSGDGGGRALLPDTLRGVLGARLARLSEPARRTLTLASVFGREFSVWAIQQAGEGAEHSVLDALEEAETNRVIAPADVPGAYRFAHGLLRDAVYDDIAASRRARLHLRAGEALAQRLAGEPEHLAALAYHFAQAIPAGGAAAAHQYAVRAAEYATRMHAHEDSVQLYGLALQALTPIGAVDQQQRCETLIALAESQNRAGEGPVARATFGQAAALAQAMLDSALKQFPTPDVHVPAMLLTRAALGIGHLSVTAGAGHEVLVQLLERAQSALGERDSAQRAMVLARLARELFFTGAPERALRLGHEANAIARRLGDSRALFDCLFSYCYLISGPDHDAERFAVTEEMLQLADSLHDAELQLYAGRRHINNLMEQGNLNGVHEHIAAFARTAAVLRQPFYLWQAGLYRAMEALLDRPLDEAERLIDQAFAARRQPDDADIRAFRAMQLLAIRRQQGRCAEQVEGAVQVVERYPGVPAHRAMLTLLLAESGRFDEARAQLQWFRDHAFATPPRDKSWFSLCAYLAEACVILNDGENAAHLYQHAAGYGHVLVTVSNAVACHGSLSRYLGLLAVTAGSRLALADGVIAQETPDDPTGSSSISAASPAEQAAERHFTAALVFNEARGLRHQLALTRIDYATFLLSGLAKDLGWTAGDGAPPLSTAQQHTADRAHALLMAAAASASALGMSALAKQTRQVLASYGGLCGATPDSGVAATDTLPPAEVVDSPDGGSLAAARAMTAAVSTTADSDPALPPMPPTVLIGRDQDVDVVLERLGHGGIRLLTLTGPPGVGKTRLATEVALLAPAVFPDGVRWVSLDTSRDRSMALSAIAAALRLPHSALGDVPGRLARAIAGQRLLLVLDNLEQVLDLAEDLPVLLSGCPNLAVLTTSRAPLRLRWEHEHPVPPLEVLQTGATSLHDAQPPDATAPLSPAAELFIVRAKAMRPNLSLSSEELSAIEAHLGTIARM